MARCDLTLARSEIQTEIDYLAGIGVGDMRKSIEILTPIINHHSIP
jgi:hypothetical protein